MTSTANAIARNAALKIKIAEMERKQRDREASQEILNENQILAQRLRDLKKAAAETKKDRKVYTRQKPYNLHSNPYLTFLSGAREGLKTEISAVQPTLKGKELTCAVTTLAGHRWRQMSAEERAGYKITPKVLFDNPADNDDEWMPWSPEAPPEKEDGLQLQEVVVQGTDGQEPFSIWIDTCSNPSAAFKSNSTDEGPIGQVFEGRYIPF
jgi:hypothetical protein